MAPRAIIEDDEQPLLRVPARDQAESKLGMDDARPHLKRLFLVTPVDYIHLSLRSEGDSDDSTHDLLSKRECSRIVLAPGEARRQRLVFAREIERERFPWYVKTLQLVDLVARRAPIEDG